jgi:PhnB protein
MADQSQGVIPHLVVDGAAEAIEFYKAALGAVETGRHAADDGKRLMHAEVEVNGAKIYLMDDFPEFRDTYGSHVLPPKSAGSTSVTLHLDVENCDAAVERAAAAGATVIMPPEDAFWGARYAQIVDPFGHSWSFAHKLPGAGG